MSSPVGSTAHSVSVAHGTRKPTGPGASHGPRSVRPPLRSPHPHPRPGPGPSGRRRRRTGQPPGRPRATHRRSRTCRQPAVGTTAPLGPSRSPAPPGPPPPHRRIVRGRDRPDHRHPPHGPRRSRPPPIQALAGGARPKGSAPTCGGRGAHPADPPRGPRARGPSAPRHRPGDPPAKRRHEPAHLAHAPPPLRLRDRRSAPGQDPGRRTRLRDPGRTHRPSEPWRLPPQRVRPVGSRRHQRRATARRSMAARRPADLGWSPRLR